jgi:putative transposase
MKRSNFLEEQVARAPAIETGTPVGDACRQLGISDATFQVWRKRERKRERRNGRLDGPALLWVADRAGDRGRIGDVQLGKGMKAKVQDFDPSG